MGVHDGQGGGAGGVGCSSGVSAQWGRGLGLCEVEADYRGSMDAPGRRVEGGGVKRWQGLGFPSPPRVQTVDDKRKGLQKKSLDSKRRSSAGLSSLSWSVCIERKREKEEKGKTRVVWSKFESKFES
jgi:hypothetical protein